MFYFSFGDSRENVERLSRRLNRFAGELRTMGSLLERLRDEVGRPAVRMNFEAGNRGRWDRLHEATYTFPLRNNPSFSNKPILNVTGHLFRAAQAKTRWSMDASIGSLFVPADTFGADVPYGYTQHEGGFSNLTGGVIPARPFFYLTEGDIKKAESIIDEWIWENYGKTIGAGARRTTVWETVRM